MAFAGLAYTLAPRRLTWRLLDGTGWVELSPALGWGEAGTAEAREDEEEDPAPAGRRLRLPWKHP